MITKRFTMVYGKYIDNENNIEYDERLESWKICDLLNEIHEENQSLKKQNKKLHDDLHKVNQIARGYQNMTKKRFTLVDDEFISRIKDNGISMTAREIVECLNTLYEENEELKEEIARQKYTKHIMRDNIKDYERAIKRLRKSYEEFDEMRLDRIRFLEKRLKKNGLSIYVNDCGDLE